ncbi:6-bladed beta-propeller [Flavobacterium sp. RS13.1]|uniref:6-bladed beta-propeller n=1 Tax=Flavobacterium sp. RS13.1 TaxID=3400345 RepID=UPI003AAB54FB
MYILRNIILIVLIFLYGCNSKNKDVKYKGKNQFKTIKVSQNSSLIQIDIPEEELFKELNTSSILDSVWHVKLQTNEQSIFGAIDQLIVYDGSIFILDTSNTNSLFEFSLNGKFIKKYGRIGKGPEEYLNPTSFGIDKKQNRIILFDDKMSKILFFNRDGSFYKAEKLDFYTSEICVFNSEKILLNNRKSTNDGTIPEIYTYYLTMINFGGQIVSKALPYDEDIINFRYHSRQDFFMSENEVLYHPALNDTIYTVSETTIKPKYVLNFGNKKLPLNFDRNIKFYDFEQKYKGKNSPYAYLVGDYMEIDNKLFFDISYQGHKVKCIYSLNSKKLQFGGKINDDLKNNFGTFSPVGFYKDWIITAVNPDMVLNKRERVKNDKINDIIDRTSMGDNPILSFQHLKNF